jgi:hypothetical protein
MRAASAGAVTRFLRAFAGVSLSDSSIHPGALSRKRREA